MTEITLSGVGKSYTPGKPVLQPLDLTIRAGEIFFLLGPSGCGKSTLLRLIAGFLAPDSGTISFDGRDVTGLAPEKRQAPMVFQNYALWPHWSVLENVTFGLRAQGLGRREAEQRAQEALEAVRMTDFADRKVPALSGGQQQRVALARALAVAPGLILLDEPLSNLDARLRDQMRGELREIFRARGLTAVYVTHDRREALSMADRIAVLHEGRLEQIGTPHELYTRPASHFVAAFLGETNFLAGTVAAPGQVKTALGVFAVPTGERAAGSSVELMLRPELIEFADPDRRDRYACCWQGVLTGESYLGEFAGWQLRCGDPEQTVTVNESAPERRETGKTYLLGIAPERVVLW